MSIPSVALSEDTPAGGDKIREGDDRIREFKQQVREIGQVDHKYDESGRDADMGKHKQITFIEADPLKSGTTGYPVLGAETIDDEPELVYNSEENIAVQLTSKGSLYGLFPSGGIIMWSGAISAIPSGWVICDGSNSTPNLTDRFVIHADADSAGTNDVGDSGGSKTISEANLPAHTHSALVGGSASKVWGPETETNRTATGTTGSTGGGTDYMPKYYALAYIMKT